MPLSHEKNKCKKLALDASTSNEILGYGNARNLKYTGVVNVKIFVPSQTQKDQASTKGVAVQKPAKN